MTSEEKKKAFDQNQDNFIYKKDIIAGVVKSDKGLKMVLNIEKRSDLTQSLGELQISIMKETISSDIKAQLQKRF